MRRLACWLLDSGPVLVLAAIAGAGSFTHIHDTASEHGQTGWMAWAVAVCVDMTCVMAARERQRDAKTGRVRSGPVSWPTLVLAGGVVLSLAANLHQAEPSVWGWLVAATPAGAFLIAVSMLERRAAASRPAPAPVTVTASAAPVPTPPMPELTPATDDGPEPAAGPSPALVTFARRVAGEHHTKHGAPITPELLRARLGVSDQLAAELLRTLHAVPQPAR
ncbi:SpdA protein [Planomonospora parontospora subsp. parontospora]|uniref:SpdA protein n=2 Tax=Planomonospora parontospora TaxID=58119 RepID=A0AA37F4Y0_9ACTN|nr:DUF2637 domain-containing protein [Planomonospora parontospora]GGK69877.1 SpdA protein [Planomonospora parontospora]GII09889.1 SpdA protein [Planomonospora parontospora subsp. parontospora]